MANHHRVVQLSGGGYAHVALNGPLTPDEEVKMVDVLNRLRAQLSVKDKPGTQEMASGKS